MVEAIRAASGRVHPGKGEHVLEGFVHRDEAAREGAAGEPRHVGVLVDRAGAQGGTLQDPCRSRRWRR